MVKRHWDAEELIDNWTLLPQELELVRHKVGANQIGFAILLKHFQLLARFPHSPTEIPEPIISYIAQQLKIPETTYSEYDWHGRSITNHRASIRQLFGFRTSTLRDSQEMLDWLKAEILSNEQRIEPITQRVYQRFRELHVEPPTPGRIERLVRSSIAQYESELCHQILEKLTPENLEQIDVLLNTAQPNLSEEKLLPENRQSSDFAFLKTDPGPVGLGSFLTETDKLKQIRAVGLPEELFKGVSVKLIQTYRQRAATESPYDIRRHKDAIRYTLMAAFITKRSQEITDNLI